MNSRNTLISAILITIVATLGGCAKSTQAPLPVSKYQDRYLGGEFEGNFVWSGAMDLAWKELRQALNEKLELVTKDVTTLDMVKKLNNSPLSENDFFDTDYYAKGGVGQDTLDLITLEAKKKFPEIDTRDLNTTLYPEEMAAYSYLTKQIEFLTGFLEKEVTFEGVTVKGFYAINQNQKTNVRILDYWDNDRFIIGLTNKENNDEIYIAKGFGESHPSQITEMINKYKTAYIDMENADRFEMPNIKMNVRRKYYELIGDPEKGPFIENLYFKQYIKTMFEIIRFEMNKKGARTENQVVPARDFPEIKASSPLPKNLFMNKPFWLILIKKDSNNPYFISHIRNTTFMEPVKRAN